MLFKRSRKIYSYFDCTLIWNAQVNVNRCTVHYGSIQYTPWLTLNQSECLISSTRIIIRFVAQSIMKSHLSVTVIYVCNRTIVVQKRLLAFGCLHVPLFTSFLCFLLHLPVSGSHDQFIQEFIPDCFWCSLLCLWFLILVAEVLVSSS